MLAAESAFEAIRAGDTSAASLSRYQQKIDASPVKAELYPVRNVHQAFGYGLFAGLAVCGAVAGDARAAGSTDLHGHPGHERMKTLTLVLRQRQPASRRARQRRRPSIGGSRSTR